MTSRKDQKQNRHLIHLNSHHMTGQEEEEEGEEGKRKKRKEGIGGRERRGREWKEIHGGRKGRGKGRRGNVVYLVCVHSEIRSRAT